MFNLKRLDVLIGFTVAVLLIVGSWREWVPFSLTETLGFITGAACVYLVVRENIWNFPIGIANNIFFFVLFFGSRLYGDASLQIVYLFLGIQGWYKWLYGGKDRTPLRVQKAARDTRHSTLSHHCGNYLSLPPLTNRERFGARARRLYHCAQFVGAVSVESKGD